MFWMVSARVGNVEPVSESFSLPMPVVGDDYMPEPYHKVSREEIHALTVRKNQSTKRSDKVRQAKLQPLGFEAEHSVLA